MATLGRAIAIASKEFQKVTDRGGNPYILHCLWVMNKVRHLGEEYMIVAVLHDLVEDTDWTIEGLRKEGYSEDILFSLNLLDFRGKVYEKQVELIAYDDKAREVKLRDLEHNTKVTRLKGLSKKDLDRTHKYHKAYIYLKSV